MQNINSTLQDVSDFFRTYKNGIPVRVVIAAETIFSFGALLLVLGLLFMLIKKVI